MVTFTSQASNILLILVFATTFHESISSIDGVVRCNEKDQQTLLVFKQGIHDSSNHLLSWSTQNDCCAWKGVSCHNTTNRVTELDLSFQLLEGEISLSLLQLEFLNHLDLSNNQFDIISIPHTHNYGISVSNLHYLDFSFNYGLHIDNLHWLSHLSSMKYLNLSKINLQNETNVLHIVSMIPSLSELRLSACSLNFNSSPEFVNFTSLVTLDLSMNYFSSKARHWLFNSSNSISYIDLSYARFSEDLNLEWLSRLRYLKYLDLSGIDLHKEINWLSAMPPSLSHLHLEDCQLTNIGPSQKYVNFTSLVDLDLSQNNFSSRLPYWLFNLSSDISSLSLSYSSLHGEIPSSLFNYQNLEYLDLFDNMFSGSIPSALGNLTCLVSLRIGYNSFSGVVSETHFSNLSNLEHMDLSHTNFAFHFNPKWIPPFQLQSLDLANTNQGPIFPPWIYTQKSLDILSISSAAISSVDREMFWSFIAGNFLYFDVSNNSISLDLSNIWLNSYWIKLGQNSFTGTLPHLSPKVKYVDLSHNFFRGSIPHDWENLKGLLYINLWGNNIFGEVLVKLLNLPQLEVMNLGKNAFSGTIPSNMSQNLLVVVLRSNQFEGSIPQQLFNLSQLIHLDLAHNKFSGSMPQVVYNNTVMISDAYFSLSRVFYDMIYFITKGQEYEYNLGLSRRTIDLSANNFSGEMPSELFKLVKLQTLNLSYNHFSGTIPKTIGGMKNLESLDLSNNKLLGEIPQNMAALTFLEYLNLSCNDFSGKIPTGTQLQGFNESSYLGNVKLCGAPLANCGTEEQNPVDAKQEEENEDDECEKDSLYLGMGIGFAVSFVGFCGSLFLIKGWRNSYYCFLNQVWDQVYVAFMVKYNNFHKGERLPIWRVKIET